MLSDFNNPIDGGLASGGSLSTELRTHLKTAGKWGRFIAIVGFVILGITIFSALIMGGGMATAMMGLDGGAGMAGFGVGIMVFYVLFLGFILYIYYLLYRFSTQAISAADGDDPIAAAESMKAMATILKIVGVLTALYLGIVAFGFIAAILGDVLGAF
ncbi:MAG: hypothetical protein AAFY76_20590 [Cyanobacteria bacterium J06649_11]